MIFLVLVGLATAGPLEDENKALREAIEHFKAESSELRLEIEDLHSALGKKDEVIKLNTDALAGYKSLLAIKDEVISARERQLDASEKLNDTLKKAYDQERESKNVGKIERTAWTIALGGAFSVAAYGALKKSPVTVNTGT